MPEKEARSEKRDSINHGTHGNTRKYTENLRVIPCNSVNSVVNKCGEANSRNSQLATRNSTQSPVPPRIGMLAGWGNYPVRVAEALRDSGYEVYCLGVRGHCDKEAELRDICTEFVWTNLGKFGRSIRYFQSKNVPDCIMLGKIHKKELFKPWALFALLPDWVTIKAFAAYFLFRKKDCRDDSLLKRIVDLYAEHGIRMGVPTDYCPALLVKEGCLTKLQPDEHQRKDIEYGWQVAKELGRFDVGQTVIVKDQMAVAIEAIEGTDACIRRAGELASRGGLVMVKVAKPQQDMRFDVPTIGLNTVKNLVAAGGKVLAIEANKTIIIDEDAVVDFANKNGLCIVAAVVSNNESCELRVASCENAKRLSESENGTEFTNSCGSTNSRNSQLATRNSSSLP